MYITFKIARKLHYSHAVIAVSVGVTPHTTGVLHSKQQLSLTTSEPERIARQC